MKINVTQAHIDERYRNYAFACPIALAIYEYEDYAIDVSVYEAKVIIRQYDGSMATFQLPPSAINFIYNLDNSRPVGPIQFIMTKELSKWNYSNKLPI